MAEVKQIEAPVGKHDGFTQESPDRERGHQFFDRSDLSGSNLEMGHNMEVR
jgi:hypothetical protein